MLNFGYITNEKNHQKLILTPLTVIVSLYHCNLLLEETYLEYVMKRFEKECNITFRKNEIDIYFYRMRYCDTNIVE